MTDSTENGATHRQPLDENPFPKDDPRHELWVDASLWVKEHLSLFVSGMMKAQPTEEAASEKHRDWLLDCVAGQFDINACGLSSLIPLTDKGAHVYELGLEQIEKFMLVQANSFRISFIPQKNLILEIRMRLFDRKQYWTGQMLKQVREAKEAKSAQRTHDAHSLPPTKLEAELLARSAEDSVQSGGQKTPKLQGGHSGTVPARRNRRYEAIDQALKSIAESRPHTQEEVFQFLDDRHVPAPPAEPFMSARGWIKGFQQHQALARAWLSKRWSELSLPPLPRGPKK